MKRRPHLIPTYGIRWMLQRDLRSIVGIEKLCVDEPWTEQDFLRALRNCAALVAESFCGEDQDESVYGFVIYGWSKKSLVLVNMGVHPGHRRRGIAKKLISRLKEKIGNQVTLPNGSKTTIERLVAHVCERNLAMQLFLREIGFKAEKVLRDYAKDGTNDAAYLFVYRQEES